MLNITTQNNKRKVHRFGVLLYWVVILKILLSWETKVRARNILFGFWVSGSSGEECAI